MSDQEREMKLYIRDSRALAERLRLSGAEEVREQTLEYNLRLDTPDGKLRKEGRLLRLRQDDRVSVAYKDQAEAHNGVIKRREIEFIADDFQVALKLFKALGYEEVVVYEKYRAIYRLGDVEVALDELPYGDFIEIEAQSNALIEGVVQMLGLDGSKAVDTNYLGLFERLKQALGFNFRDLTFDNFKGVDVSWDDMGVEPADVR
jgi:adenylate cyclase, class 2